MPSLDDHLAAARSRRARRGTRTLGVPAPGPMVDLASNDYLGLARDAAVVAAAREALDRYGTGTGGSRVVAGNTELHAALDAALADLTGFEAALSVSSGYLANLAVLTALTSSDALVVVDEHAHASLVDGARLSRLPMQWAEHNDPSHVDALLARHGRPGAIVVVESVYSAAGDAAPLAAYAEVCARRGATLLVDEAHGLGTLGPGGAGGVAAAGLSGAPHVVVTGALGKACAAQGGFVAASAQVVEHLVAEARPVVFDTAAAPATVAAALAAVRRILAEPALVQECRDHAAELARATGQPAPAAAIVSVPVPDDAVVARARKEGLLLGCFRPGSTPDGRYRLRLTAHAGLSPADRARASAFLNNVQPA